ncbi:protein patched [Bacillus rossius redtenbacheri]|uniref:protein patched n=1 Tax=Bacillus rossius redtenbacheri TaxID=93214 RepID=UPI002FDE87E1
MVASRDATSARHGSDLYVRTSWADAELALRQIDKGAASGNRAALWARGLLQQQLFQLGCFVQRHAGKVLFVAILVLATFCVGLKSAQVHTRVDQLWVQEGGRLERELRYTQAALGEADSSTHQLVIQTSRDETASLLHPAALLAHLAVVRAAASVTVHLFDITWRLKDMCYSPSIPNFDEHYIDQIFQDIIPCAVITPLDCFWEGSKLLGPEFPVHIPALGSKVRWTNLSPLHLIEQMKSLHFSFPFDTLEDYMKRAGVSTGYQEKPCLDPSDAECPDTAPNKKLGQPPDVGAELTGGCYGFAAKYMHWPEDLVVGGAVKNKTGHIKKAHGLQTVVQLMGEREMFELWSKTYKVHHIDWTQEKAAVVLETWQRRFAQEVQKQMRSANSSSGPYNMYAFSTSSLNDLLTRFSELSVFKVVICFVLMVAYVSAALVRWRDPVRSQAGVGAAGVLLVAVSAAAGLGFCALLGIAFNAATLQILPFLALGLGVENLFLVARAYADDEGIAEHRPDEQTGVVLKRIGVNIILSSLSNICAFFSAAIIPVPALRVFSLQAAVLMVFNLGATLLVFPALVSLDLWRRRSGRADLPCCCLPAAPGGGWPCLPPPPPVAPDPPRKLQTIARALPPDRQQTVTVLAPPAPASPQAPECWVGSTRELLTGDPEKGGRAPCQPRDWSLSRLAARHYAPLLARPRVKAACAGALALVLAASSWGATKVRDGLELTDVVPQGTDQHAFLAAQGRYFGFYDMRAVTTGDFEYPTNQRLLHEYHEGFMRVPSVVKNDDGGLPDFWLSMFRDWLTNLQRAFDRDWRRGSITQERWFANASDEGILAYKLLVQTGHVDNPVDKSLVASARLVDADGIINPKAFYNYLSAWAHNDALAYGASQASLRPEPKEWHHAASDYELKIPKSGPLTYAQIPLYLRGLNGTERVTEALAQVRELCRRFEERGLPNYPSGIPFLFWEQYLGLRRALGLALACALAGGFGATWALALSARTAALAACGPAAVALQLLGAMGLAGVRLSAVPAVLLVLAVGVGARFTAHLCFGFVTAIGCRNRRVQLSLEKMFPPVVHSAFALLIGVLMLAFSEFDFIVRYFFYVLFVLVLIGLVNGLVFFPVILSLIGPGAEVEPRDHEDRIATPSPPPSPARHRTGSCRVGRVAPPPRAPCGVGGGGRLHAAPSLTTITEEGNSWQSSRSTHSTHEIVVQPELVVETTTNYGPATQTTTQTGDRSSSQSSTPPPPGHSVTTKVTATAHVKVEVHTPLSGSADREAGSSGGSSSRSRSSRGSRDSGSESDSAGRNGS